MCTRPSRIRMHNAMLPSRHSLNLCLDLILPSEHLINLCQVVGAGEERVDLTDGLEILLEMSLFSQQAHLLNC